jgi:serine/threonine protein kinase/WD40 repeat protein
MSRNADRNLLLGILAFQLDFISREALIEAIGAWTLAKDWAIEDILVDRGLLDPADRDALRLMLERQIARHQGDPEMSLAALSSVDAARAALARIVDPEIRASLATAGTDWIGGDAGATRSPGDPGAAAGPRYQRLRPHARGNLGEVFVARDVELNREVALKEIQGRHADDPESRARFLIEAEVTGGLEHPGIVPVYGLGQYPDGRPFYAMRFIQGDSLSEAIRIFHADPTYKADSGERHLALQKLLRRFLDVCNAVGYAHSRGILHRDLKPGNIMAGRYGETLVVDWGLAKPIGQPDPIAGAESESPLVPASGSGMAATIAGATVGTPAYMPPEQAAGRVEDLGPRSDVYSLGATLYHLLTDRAPFVGRDIAALLGRVERGEFPTPRSIQPDVPRGLEAICLKAMARCPEDRYESTLELAADIEHWLADEPVSAWREPVSYRLGRWAKAHRPLVVSAAVVLITLIAGSFWLYRSDLEHRREVAEASAESISADLRRAEAETRRNAAELTSMSLVKNVRAGRNSPRPGWTWDAIATLASAATIGESGASRIELASETAQCLAAYDARPAFESNHGLDTSAMAFSPDGKTLAVVEFKAQSYTIVHVYLIDVATQSVRHRWTIDGKAFERFFKYRSQEGGRDLAFSPDGRWLALGMRTGRMFVWDATRPERPAVSWQAHDGVVTRLRFDPGSRAIWTISGTDRLLKRWRLDGDRWVSDRPDAERRLDGELSDLALGPGVVWVAERDHSRVVAIDPASLKSRGDVSGFGDKIAASPNGRTLVGISGASVRFADAERLSIFRTVAYPGIPAIGDPGYNLVEFSPDGAHFAAITQHDLGNLTIWDTASGHPVAEVPWGGNGIGRFAFSPDSTLLAVNGARKTVFYAMRARGPLTTLGHSPTILRDFAWATDRSVITVGDRDRECQLRLIDTSTGAATREVNVAAGDHHARIVRLAVHPGGGIAAQCATLTYLWKAGLASPPEQLPVEFLGDLGFNPEGNRLWGYARDDRIDVWSIPAKSLQKRWKDPFEALFLMNRQGINGLAVGDRWVVAAGNDGIARVLDAREASNAPATLWPRVEPLEGVAIDRAETLAAMGTLDGRVYIRSLPGGEEVARIDTAHRGVIGTLDFAPDARSLATGSVNGTLRTWTRDDAGQWQVSLTLGTGLGPVVRLHFSPDGHHLAALIRNETALRIWDLDRLRDQLAALGFAKVP